MRARAAPRRARRRRVRLAAQSLDLPSVVYRSRAVTSPCALARGPAGALDVVVSVRRPAAATTRSKTSPTRGPSQLSRRSLRRGKPRRTIFVSSTACPPARGDWSTRLAAQPTIFREALLEPRPLRDSGLPAVLRPGDLRPAPHALFYDGAPGPRRVSRGGPPTRPHPPRLRGALDNFELADPPLLSRRRQPARVGLGPCAVSGARAGRPGRGAGGGGGGGQRGATRFWQQRLPTTAAVARLLF